MMTNPEKIVMLRLAVIGLMTLHREFIEDNPSEDLTRERARLRDAERALELTKTDEPINWIKGDRLVFQSKVWTFVGQYEGLLFFRDRKSVGYLQFDPPVVAACIRQGVFTQEKDEAKTPAAG